MHTSRWLLSWLNVPVVVSLLLASSPLLAQATCTRESHSISRDANGTPLASPLPAVSGSRTSPHSLPREAAAVIYPSARTAHSAWWPTAVEEGRSQSDPFHTLVDWAEQPLLADPEWVYVFDVYDYTTDSSHGHEWVGSPSNLAGPPDGIKFGADSGPYQGSYDWVYLDMGTFLPTGTEGCWLGWESSRYTLCSRQVWDGQQWRNLPGWHNLDCTQFPGGSNNFGFHSDWRFRYVRFQAIMNIGINYQRLLAVG